MSKLTLGCIVESMQTQSNKVNNFTDLIAWQEAHTLVLLVYNQIKVLPVSEKYNLISQLQRASVSITSNIAEGFTRHSVKDKIHFLQLSLGSAKEVENQLLICRDLGYISSGQYEELNAQTLSVCKLINALIGSLSKYK